MPQTLVLPQILWPAITATVVNRLRSNSHARSLSHAFPSVRKTLV
jgi:hypothetical protein